MIGEKLGPYEILESIGSGGMGSVYKARDTRLGRIVAIKKVKEQHSERFKQEARYIAALNHPNICQIHDIGDDFLVLEYVDGKPLSSPLQESEAIGFAIQIATALEAAHKNGIIHRDLKPSNIMVTGERTVKLLDFGLAKLYEQDVIISSLPTADFPVTQAGAILGTVAYMSPEQAQGKPADACSDIFSFGLVLYEMLSGRRAFSGNSNFKLMEAIIRKEPAPLKTSSALEKIIRRCLQKNPSERYQTIAEVKEELQKAFKPKVTVALAEPQPSIAVLPFVNMSGDKEQEYFSDGLAEEIINALTKIPRLKVTARTSAFAFKGKDQDITKIAEALRVSSILEGSVRKAGSRIRVTAQLISASDGNHLWSERYDRDLTDVFAIQDEISQAIADKLRMHLAEKRTQVRPPTVNMEAYNFNLKGRYYLYKLTPEGTAKGREYFEQAIEMDPNYASAWHGLAAIHHISAVFGMAPSGVAMEKSRQAVMKALELDEMLPDAHAHLGVLLASEFNWKGAEVEFLRAMELGSGWHLYAYYYLLPMRRFEEAMAAMRREEDLNPLSALIQTSIASIYNLIGQYDKAIEYCEAALELDPNALLARISLANAYFQKGEVDEGLRIGEAVAKSMGRNWLAQGMLGWAYASSGRTREAHQLLEEMLNTAQSTNVPPLSIAVFYMRLGEVEECFDWLFKAAEQRDSTILQLFQYPTSGSLRSHPRYKALLRKMNLEP